MKKLAIIATLVVLAASVVFAQAKQSAVSKEVMDRGKTIYETNCQACHQPNGMGVPRLNPPLAKTQYVVGDKARLIQIVAKGLNETIIIDDEEYANPMPAFPQLTDQQVADVLTYVRNSFGNKATAITTAQVKVERAKIK